MHDVLSTVLERFGTSPTLAAAGLLAVASCVASAADGHAHDADAKPTVPEVGDTVSGDAVVLTAAGDEVTLGSLWEDGPVVVTFYRGGWCPFCTEALQDWRTRVEELDEAGASFVAITPEKPSYTSATEEKYDLPYDVYSDASFAAADTFGLRFSLPAEIQTRYKGFGIDLGKHNATETWELPIPGTFVIDTDGVVRFVYADEDFRKRVEPDEVIAAVRGLQAE